MCRRTRIVLGLNSGTSVDGVDAVACEIEGRGLSMRVRVIGHVASVYPPALRTRLLDVMAPARTTTEELCRLNTAVGDVFAQVATKAMKKLGLSKVDFVGSHGQTICHLPPTGRAGRREVNRATGAAAGAETGTWQIGDAAIIAAAVGAPVVSQFRHGDMAAGGQGAPLVPWTDYVLFRDAKKSRVIQNIGGIANLTWLPAGASEDDVIAFDCGPGNMIIDSLVHRFTGGKQAFDKGGAMAARGTVLPDVLAAMLEHPFVSKRPPKSCGREEFGAGYVEALQERFSHLPPQRGSRSTPEDWVRTATRFTAECMARAYATLVGGSNAAAKGSDEARRLSAAARVSRSGKAPPAGRMIKRVRGMAGGLNRIDEVILCGGGAKNKALLADLMDAMSALGIGGGVSLTPMDRYGISTQAKECVSFAMLAAARMDGVAANLPGVTGARQRVVLGSVTSA